MPFVYHLCADDFRGTTLFPLNALRVAYPDVYDRECAKWAGRESVLQWQVPHLGVAWGDTVNLAALDPVHLIQARKRLGVPFSRLLERRSYGYQCNASLISAPSFTTAVRTG